MQKPATEESLDIFFLSWVPGISSLAVDTKQNDQIGNCSKLYFILSILIHISRHKRRQEFASTQTYSKFFPKETKVNAGIEERPSILNFF